ncbi:MAG: hypothetical protein ACREKG_08995 [Candidatus Rokuibacteriota bacterium]
MKLEVEDVACRIAIEGVPPLMPGASLRAAVGNAEKDVDPDGSARCRLRCSSQDARDLSAFLDRAAAVLQVRGDYERSTACAQGAERVRRVLAGHPRT